MSWDDAKQVVGPQRHEIDVDAAVTQPNGKGEINPCLLYFSPAIARHKVGLNLCLAERLETSPTIIRRELATLPSDYAGTLSPQQNCTNIFPCRDIAPTHSTALYVHMVADTCAPQSVWEKFSHRNDHVKFIRETRIFPAS